MPYISSNSFFDFKEICFKQLKALKISLLVEKPSALNNMVTGNFRLRSIIANKASFISVVKSNQDPLKGIILAWNSFAPFGWIASSKNTPGLLCNWETITRSAPLITKVPYSVIAGILPKYTSVFLNFEILLVP